jgi:type 1 glutamine amidotransferase
MKKIILIFLLMSPAFQLFADKWDNKTAELKGKKILVFTKNGEGFVHDNLEANVNMFLRLGKQYGFTVDSTSNSAVFSTSDLFQYDAVVFANTNNKVFENEAEKEGLINFNRQGKGIIGIHIACGTEREWDWFTALGHKKEDYSDPQFIRHIVGSLQWVLVKKKSSI